jgi:hypothetical protein
VTVPGVCQRTMTAPMIAIAFLILITPIFTRMNGSALRWLLSFLLPSLWQPYNLSR